MSTPQKKKGPQIQFSHRSMGTTSKRQTIRSRSRSGTVGTSSSVQWGNSSTPDVSKFRPNSEAEARFNHSFKSRLMFVSQGVILDEFFETLIYTYFTKWGWQRLSVFDELSI